MLTTAVAPDTNFLSGTPPAPARTTGYVLYYRPINVPTAGALAFLMDCDP
jgi:hypothetical protein